MATDCPEKISRLGNFYKYFWFLTSQKTKRMLNHSLTLAPAKVMILLLLLIPISRL
jgi:hypothetical protein